MKRVVEDEKVLPWFWGRGEFGEEGCGNGLRDGEERSHSNEDDGVFGNSVWHWKVRGFGEDNRDENGGFGEVLFGFWTKKETKYLTQNAQRIILQFSP